MTNSVEEQISALMDGELHEHELPRLLEHMRKDAGLNERWERYHLIRDALHKNLPQDPRHDLGTRVRNALASEPHLLAPPRRPWLRHPLKQAAGGLAIAASVAALAIFAVQSANHDESPMVATAVPDNTRIADAQVMRTDPRLDSFLMNHNEHSATAGMHGMLPYVRIVSDDEMGKAP